MPSLPSSPELRSKSRHRSSHRWSRAGFKGWRRASQPAAEQVDVAPPKPARPQCRPVLPSLSTRLTRQSYEWRKGDTEGPFSVQPSTPLLRCLKACGSPGWETTQSGSTAVPANAVWWSPCLTWQMIAATTAEERAGAWDGRGPGNKERCCLGTVPGTDLGKAGPGRYGHGAAPGHQGGTPPFQGYV